MTSDGKMYVNKIDKKIKNNETMFYSKGNTSTDNIVSGKNIYQKINKVFNSRNYIYKADLILVTKAGEVSKRVIGRNNNYLITDKGDMIPITDILDIKYQ